MPANRAQQTKTADRRRQAVELRIAGRSWQQIADQLEYSSKGAACTDVRRALEKAVEKLAIPLEAHRQLELDRLDAIQNALWDKVLDGDTKAIDTTLRLMDRRAKLLGLDAPQRHELTLEAIDAALADVEQQLAAARSEAAEAEGAEEEEG
ncbi:hypothetical protein ABIA32_002704 [Streptacidiphilus sp. MAP12-20]|uniref:hypothetical protein n=1 Tax=Streptacidiphilus sp. MAP12-20 TaxID=3156299 RepID=UPI003515F074